MPKSRFSAEIKIFNGNPFVYVSPARARAIKPGWRRPLPVLVRINGQPEEKPWRVEVEFDSAYRNGPMHSMPSWFRLPLSRNAQAKTAWAKLIPSRKKEILLHVLSGKGGRFMARSW